MFRPWPCPPLRWNCRASSICGISLRISAESSTTSTRTCFRSCLASRGAVSARRARSVWCSSRPESADAGCLRTRPRVTCSTTREQIQNQHHTAIAKNGSAADQIGREGLSSSALMTNSSSPSSASTIKPYFLSPTVMTSTKSLLIADRRPQPERGPDATAANLVAQLQHFIIVDLVDFGFEGAGNFG